MQRQSHLAGALRRPPTGVRSPRASDAAAARKERYVVLPDVSDTLDVTPTAGDAQREADKARARARCLPEADKARARARVTPTAAASSQLLTH